MIRDLAAAEEDLSMAQRVLIDRVITFLGVIRLIEEHAREHGILDAKGELTSGLTHHYLSFNGHIKDRLALLGMEKRGASEALDLGRYLEAKDAEKRAATAENRTTSTCAGRSRGQGPAFAGKN